MSSQVHPQFKNVILKIQDGGRSMRLRDPFCIIMTDRDFTIFKMTAVRHLEFLIF